MDFPPDFPTVGAGLWLWRDDPAQTWAGPMSQQVGRLQLFLLGFPVVTTQGNPKTKPITEQ